eukprot:349961-Chlamydomonas_euryale.AAC.5
MAPHSGLLLSLERQRVPCRWQMPGRWAPAAPFRPLRQDSRRTAGSSPCGAAAAAPTRSRPGWVAARGPTVGGDLMWRQAPSRVAQHRKMCFLQVASTTVLVCSSEGDVEDHAASDAERGGVAMSTPATPYTSRS